MHDAFTIREKSLIFLMMEAKSSSESSVNSYRIERRNIIEDIHLPSDYSCAKFVLGGQFCSVSPTSL
jgi:hypothetical protein